MASFPTSHHFTLLAFLILFLKTHASDPVSSFSFTDFEKDPFFKPSVALYGGAEVVNGGSEVLLSGSGRVMSKNPVKLVEGAPRELVSFSTYFAFSISLGGGNGIAFVMVPSGFEGEVFENSSSGFSIGMKETAFKVIGVEFIASKGSGDGDSSGLNVAINVGNSVPASKSNLSVNGGEKMHAWIDYVASSRRLEVRLSQFGHSRPSDPVLWHAIDFSSVWETKEMFVGFTPLKGDNDSDSQSCFLHSWSFIVRLFPHWMHSEPLDPKVDAPKKTDTPVVVKPKSDCFLKILAAMIFGAGCGALTAFIALYLWTIFSNRRPVTPEEYVMQPVDFEYKKVDILVDKSSKGAKE